MNDLLPLLLAVIIGAGLGLFYFGGLWLTVQRLPQSGQPGLLTFGSLLVRTVVVLAGFYLVMDGRWERLVACLAGFIVMRIVLVRRWGPSPTQPSSTTE